MHCMSLLLAQGGEVMGMRRGETGRANPGGFSRSLLQQLRVFVLYSLLEF